MVTKRLFAVALVLIVCTPHIFAASPVWSEDFDSLTPGSNWQGRSGLTIMKDGGVDNSQCLRVEYDIREGPTGTTVKQFRQPVPPALEYTLQYDLYFEYNWSNSYGGKFHGFAPVNHVTGCRPVEDHTWSARMVLRNREPFLYLYDQNKTGRCGRRIGGSDFRMEKGRWYSVSYYLRVNSSANKSDGAAQIYIDGELMSSASNMQFHARDGDDTKINNFFFSTFLVRNSTGNVVSRQYMRYDNFAVMPGKAIRKAPGTAARNRERPFILVEPGDRAAILEKIENDPRAQERFNSLIENLDQTVELHQSDPEAFLKGMPFDWSKEEPGEIPPFLLTRRMVDGEYRNLDNATREEWAPAGALSRYLQIANNCGIAYFLTNEEKYAQCGVDILYTFIKGVLQAEISDWRRRGGWLFPDDGFREVRVIGHRPPIIYDFVAPFIRKGGKPFDFRKSAKIPFPLEEAQEVFRTYAGITVHYGQTGSNHPILESPNLVYNALAMEDETERNKWLSHFLTESTENYDALNVMAEHYKNKGDVWPESSQYVNAAASRLTSLMLLVNRYDPSLRLGDKYRNILFALPALQYMVFPNNQMIRWGDGRRGGGRPPYRGFENAYLLGRMDGVAEITSTFGPLLNKAVKEGKHRIAGGLLNLPYTLDNYEFETEPVKLPRTDTLAHAGIFLQRNLSETGDPDDGLMCFVGGAHMVHGHAEGMNIELYGCGHVLGVDNGRGRYQQDIHENYSRLFAAHNTVIVNGNSRGDGGWVNLGINTVQLVAMEPMPREEAISPYHSFSVTSFVDDKGDKAEAYQERTLALVRTSATTGYYVDVFRSKSKLPDEYHDYLYHNIGDSLDFPNNDLSLKPTPDRFMANAHLPWVQNRQYRHPGWHFFEDVKSSAVYTDKLSARFTAEHLGQKPIYMDLHIPGFEQREYTRVKAPPTFESPRGYRNKPTPTLVIRKKGEAWNAPFVVVFEPFEGDGNNSVRSVEKLEQNGLYKGLKVVSETEAGTIIQYIITQPADEVFESRALNLFFEGTFAIITLDEKKEMKSIYIGEGRKMTFGQFTITLNDGENGKAFVDFQ